MVLLLQGGRNFSRRDWHLSIDYTISFLHRKFRIEKHLGQWYGILSFENVFVRAELLRKTFVGKVGLTMKTRVIHYRCVLFLKNPHDYRIFYCSRISPRHKFLPVNFCGMISYLS